MPTDIIKPLAQTVVHEIGHRFDLVSANFPYIDTFADVPNHANSDSCIMSYSNNWTNDITEFSLEAVLHGSQTGDPGLRLWRSRKWTRLCSLERTHLLNGCWGGFFFPSSLFGSE